MYREHVAWSAAVAGFGHGGDYPGRRPEGHQVWTSPANAIDRPRHQVVLPRNNGAGNERWKRAPQRRRRRAEGPAARTHVGTEGQSRRRPCPAAALGPRLLRTSERKRRRAPGNRRPLEVPGHARVERFTRYVIFHPKRPSEAPGNALEAPRITRNHLRTGPKRCETPRKCPPVFPFVPACLLRYLTKT